MRKALDAGSRLVVKVGSSSLVSRDGTLDETAVERVASEVAGAWRAAPERSRMAPPPWGEPGRAPFVYRGTDGAGAP